MKQLTMLVALVLVVSACSSGGDSYATGSPVTGLDSNAAREEPAADEDLERTADGEAVSFTTPEDRKVIQRASITIEATDTRTTYQTIQRMVDESGGFIQSAAISDPESPADQPQIEMVLRIPAADLTSVLEEIGALATRVVSQSQQGQDVTEEYVDVQARIDNLALLETELRALLADVRQNPEADPAKLLQVFEQISQVRGQIEQLEGRRQILDDLTSLATITVAIHPTPAVTPVVAEGWAPLSVAREALADLVAAFQGLAELGIRFLVYVVPLLLIFVGLPGLIIWRLRHRLRFSRDIPSA